MTRLNDMATRADVVMVMAVNWAFFGHVKSLVNKLLDKWVVDRVVSWEDVSTCYRSNRFDMRRGRGVGSQGRVGGSGHMSGGWA